MVQGQLFMSCHRVQHLATNNFSNQRSILHQIRMAKPQRQQNLCSFREIKNPKKGTTNIRALIKELSQDDDKIGAPLETRIDGSREEHQLIIAIHSHRLLQVNSLLMRMQTR